MGFNEWSGMCPHTVTIEPFTSVDLYGNYTYGAPVTYSARVQGKNQLITAMSGEEAVSRVTVYIPYATVGPRDRITLPAIFQPTQPSILDVRQVSDEFGQHHTVILT